MKVYKKFRQLNIDHSIIGLGKDSVQTKYFCTPKGTKMIANAGTDGICYAFINGLEDMVFAINPSNPIGENVYPIAKNFGDLLRLLLSCGSMDAIEQTYMWDEELFEQYRTDNPASEEQKFVFRIIQKELQIAPMEYPFSYIKKLQKSFDYSQLLFSKEYQHDLEELMPKAPIPPEWKVAYEEGFFSKRGRAGKEVRVGTAFIWGEEKWHVPAVYLCSKGLVIDFCVEADIACVKSFFEKWQLFFGSYMEHTEEEQEKIRQEHPLNIGFQAEISVNQVSMNQTYSYGMSWISLSYIVTKQKEEHCVCEPVVNADCEVRENDEEIMAIEPEDSLLTQVFELGASLETKWLLEHYGYDTNRTWAIQRVGFPWKEKKPRAINSLILKLERNKVNVYGLLFL